MECISSILDLKVITKTVMISYINNNCKYNIN